MLFLGFDTFLETIRPLTLTTDSVASVVLDGFVTNSI